MKYNATIFLAFVFAIMICHAVESTRLQAAVPVVWDGSAGPVVSPDPDINGKWRWEQGNWTKNGTPGQIATATMGNNNGGRGGMDIVLGNGAQVYYDENRPSTVPGALGDFFPSMDQNGPGSFTIKEGAVLSMVSKSDIDGRWPQISINFNLDNGTLRRTYSSPSVAGGRIIFGFYNLLLPNTRMEVNLTNGGRIESAGKMVFGHPEVHPDNGHNAGIEVAMSINNGTLDLTGGADYDDFFGALNGELTFFYEYAIGVGPKNEKYSINFTGPGSITVDTGIFVAEQTSDGSYLPKGGLAPDLYTSLTYQDLWTLDILQANGASGSTPGATFSNYFSTSGSPGSPNYTLTSLVVPPGQDGDHNEDGVVDAADYVAWRKNPADFGGDPAGYNTWRQNFGEPSGSGGGGGVPEPNTAALLMIGMAAIVNRRHVLRKH